MLDPLDPHAPQAAQAAQLLALVVGIPGAVAVWRGIVSHRAAAALAASVFTLLLTALALKGEVFAAAALGVLAVACVCRAAFPRASLRRRRRR